MRNFNEPSRAFVHRQNLLPQLGFSYFWLLFLVAFLGVGLALTSEVLVTAQQRDKERELLAIGQHFRHAIASYYETQSGGAQVRVSPSTSASVTGSASNTTMQRQYPASLEDLLLDQRSQSTKRHLRKIFVDPITGKAEWGLYKQGGRIVGVFSLSEKQPIKVEGFEVDDASFRQKTKYSDWIFAYPADVVERTGNRLGSIQGSSSQMATTPTVNLVKN